MNVLVDTSVWSLALRRRATQTNDTVKELSELVQEGRAAMLGLVRQELLSGVRTAQQFEILRGHLKPFPDLLVETADHEEAAAFCNRCRSKGVQGSTIDFLICAVASRREISIFATDSDFEHYAKHIPIHLHKIRS